MVFDTLKEAQDFANQIHVYDNKVLDCKVSLQHQDYITTSLNNIREPKKIFVDKIPKKVNKKDLENTFGVYGEIEEIIVIEKEKRSIKDFESLTTTTLPQDKRLAIPIKPTKVG